MATTNNAAVYLPDVIQVLQLFMNDSLMPGEYQSFEFAEGRAAYICNIS